MWISIFKSYNSWITSGQELLDSVAHCTLKQFLNPADNYVFIMKNGMNYNKHTSDIGQLYAILNEQIMSFIILLSKCEYKPQADSKVWSAIFKTQIFYFCISYDDIQENEYNIDTNLTILTIFFSKSLSSNVVYLKLKVLL